MQRRTIGSTRTSPPSTSSSLMRSTPSLTLNPRCAVFQDAEEDYRKHKDKSPLHIIIFDEIDAIINSQPALCSVPGCRGGL
mmetsp:Transcript_62099/g.196364  ORF Transcript_62099/g.196364 Transcript_62099/m.196364 type:complete len:81 (-) Transcript_62099:84-326(-)